MGDRTRPVEGSFTQGRGVFASPTGAFSGTADTATNTGGGEREAGYRPVYFKSGNVVPTDAVNLPRSWGALVCVYLGHPGA